MAAQGTADRGPEQPEPTALPGPAWFGCVDLKYGEGGSVKVLELGDGHTSGFTGAGAFLPRKFKELGCSRRALGPFLDTLIENKVLTSDAFIDARLEWLRPRAATFPCQYTAELADEVLRAIGGGTCVLKLPDRQRGCGVVAVEPLELEETLRRLLEQEESDVQEERGHRSISAAGSSSGAQRTEAWAAAARHAASLCGLEEQVAHWRADECPNFLVEERCISKLVSGPDGHRYDGTLRVGFALVAGSARLLGSYWKLPDATVDDHDVDLSTRVVSHARGGLGTTACAAADEAAVWKILEGPLVQLLCRSDGGHHSVPALIDRYSENPLFLAVALTRVAGGQFEANPDVAERTLFLAEQLIDGYAESPQCRVYSYIKRTKGTLLVRRGGGKGALNWPAGAAFFDEAVAALPESAAATYLAGMTRLMRGAHAKAAELFARSVATDCDFAPAYCQLATCCLLLGDPAACLQVCDAALSRHSRVAAAHHARAVALYAQEAAANERGITDFDRRQGAASSLWRAKELQRGQSWGPADEEMLAVLGGEFALPPRPVRTWLFHAWRL